MDGQCGSSFRQKIAYEKYCANWALWAHFSLRWIRNHYEYSATIHAERAIWQQLTELNSTNLHNPT